MKNFIIEYYKQNNLPLNDLIIFGIRNKENFELDMFNDWIGFIYNEQLNIAKATTDPGVYYTKNPMNSNGAFHMDLGFHKEIWRLRKHRGQYMALCNDSQCEKVRGYRNLEPDKIIYGWVSTNLHTTQQEEFINLASAGCQVTPDKNFFDDLIKKAKESKQERFSYNLFSIKEIPINLIYNYLAKV